MTDTRRFEPKIKIRKSEILLAKKGKYHTKMITKIEGSPEKGSNRAALRKMRFAKRKSSKPLHPINTPSGRKAKDARLAKQVAKHLKSKKK